MLQIQHLNLSMKKDLRDLVQNLSLTVTDDDKIALIGEEGNGKSTLLKLIYDPEQVEDYAEWSGTILRGDMVLGYLAQELPTEQAELTAYEFSCAEPAFFDTDPKELSSLAAELSMSIELFYSDRKMKTLSGGEKVKLRMALLTLRRPALYLLDEPSNDLDIPTLEWLEEFINHCPAPVLFISHDETFLEHTANGILHLEQLRRKTLPRHTFVRMGYRQYVDERSAKFTRQEQLARKEQEEERKQLERFRQITQRVEHEQNTIGHGNPAAGRLLKKKMHVMKSMEHRFERQHENMTRLPEFEESILASFAPEITVPAGKTVLDFQLKKLEAEPGHVLAENIQLNIRGAEHVCIIGKNGCGKTTLLRRIAEELLPRTDIKAFYMPQDYAETIDQSLTPVEFLANSSHKDELTRVKTYLGSMKYTAEECAHSISELSGGQRAKLFFLKMILDGCNVLILDEPTRNFSPLSNPVIRQILRDFGGCIISVSHDRKYIAEVADRIYELTESSLNICS